MWTWSVRSPARSRMLTGARRPTRHPDGTSHRSAPGPGKRRNQRKAAAAMNCSSAGGAATKSPARRSNSPVSSRPATTSGSASRNRANSILVTTPSTAVSAKARSRVRSAAARSGAMRNDFGQHRVVIAADDHPRGQARIDPHARRIGFHHGQHIATGGQEAAAPDPRRRPALQSRGPARQYQPDSTVSFSPAAIRTCHSTRSHPVTSSVTGCSTCSRVFISMKKNSSGRSAETMNSTVPAPV